MKEYLKIEANYVNNVVLSIRMETVTISKEEYESLKKKAIVDEDLLLSLVRGLEDIRAGRIKPWKKSATE